MRRGRTRLAYLLLVLILLASAGSAYAEPSGTVLAAIGEQKQGEAFIIQGTTGLPELIVQVLRPNQSILEMDQLTKEQFQIGKTLTLPADAPVGIYTVKAGVGSEAAVMAFKVVAGDHGGEPGPGPEPQPQPALELSPIGAVEAGRTIRIQGTTNQLVLLWRLFAPDGTLLKELAITRGELEQGYAYTIPADAVSGVYTLKVGNGSVSGQLTIQVTRNDTGTPGDRPSEGSRRNRSSVTVPTPVKPEPQQDGSVALLMQPQGPPDAAGAVQVAVTQEAIDQAVAQLQAGALRLRIEAAPMDGAKAYAFHLPAGVLVEKIKGLQIELRTEFAGVTVQDSLFRQSETAGAQTVSLTIGQAQMNALSPEAAAAIGTRPAILVRTSLDGKAVDWPNREAPVVAIPYTPSAAELADPNGITVWSIDRSGQPSPVPSGHYDKASGKVIFRAALPGHYAVVHVTKTFTDLTGYAWAEKPIRALAAKGILMGVAPATFAPEAPIKRADFVLLLVRTLELQAPFKDSFDDVRPEAYYYEALGTARVLGISDGAGDNRFQPERPISRQEMMTLTVRALHTAGLFAESSGTDARSELQAFADSSQVADYAASSVAALIREGLIEGSGGSLHPQDSTSRAETAVMLYRIVQHIAGGM
ncbi:S-layer homology domain-containing protein [Paenibacillus sp. H1-7]|uniref:S-layer homology domain-containing protein n=1 Tax=Paenibacillus sp. H1-7 TaxID=2282849 RepID=UPI001EF782FE|nr:S-layer homology domain-containing protein [Paenibacillus sp. H1-7]ULL15151.1 S-layer homology domain-containing protein [Paenibacillus sp. H1-7]